MADAACEVWFYHLEQTSLDQALPDLLERTLAKGWRALVRTGDPARLGHLDGWLWTYRGYKRCVDLFDGRDPHAVEAARARWRAAKAQGVDLAYWKQGARGWERQA